MCFVRIIRNSSSVPTGTVCKRVEIHCELYLLALCLVLPVLMHFFPLIHQSAPHTKDAKECACSRLVEDLAFFYFYAEV